MLSKPVSKPSATDPIAGIAIAGLTTIVLASAVAWYFLTDHSLRETAAIVSAVALVCGLALLGLNTLRSLVGVSRR